MSSIENKEQVVFANEMGDELDLYQNILGMKLGETRVVQFTGRNLSDRVAMVKRYA